MRFLYLYNVLTAHLTAHLRAHLTAQNGDDKEGVPDRDIGILEAPTKPKLKEPPMYKVIMLNDDYTPMEFVVEVLQMFFGMNREKATQVMLAVHTQGKATCGIFTRDVAETKSAQVNQYAQDNQHPLVSDVEAVQ
jgi:ATP-dependent Clp protease adaptor protein ClpS